LKHYSRKNLRIQNFHYCCKFFPVQCSIVVRVNYVEYF
jgi:hypothetical protein